MNKTTSSLTEQDFVRLPADRSLADAIVRPSVSYWRDVLRRIRSDKVAIVSLTFLVIIILMAVFAPILSPYGYETTDLLHTNQPPSAEHWFGTDAGGRDLWTRVWVGARISLIIGLGGAIVPQIIGIFLGGLSGFFQTFSYFSGKLQENRIGFLSGGQVTGKGGGIADSFRLRRFALQSRIIDSICIFPQHFAVAFQMHGQDCRIHLCQIANGTDFEFLKNRNGGMSCHEQTADRQRPHFLLDLLRKKRVRLIRLFKIRSHLCQNFIRRNPDVDRKTEMAVNIVADVGSPFFR